ncbi:hypothetical protein [Roseateles violae]|uniref:PspA/IM30 family protein n=1 Tax=Roseateles violae TaxID=3058042 RepID=A0ABT8DV12_9BURK|nr:hypothetical protein [Pelomonas sp. PFR6]MDN3922120.1 hypothetical protein [Pelomonas sp. PFR6]
MAVDEVGAIAIPGSLSAALGDWARQIALEASAGPRASLAQAEGELAAQRQAGEALAAERADLQARLAQATAALEQAQAGLAERGAAIERLTVELRSARTIASDALVGKAKDQLAIEGKDAQLAELRRQLERNLAASAADSDARLAAEMELVGAVTARDNFAAEVAELRTQLEARLRAPA